MKGWSAGLLPRMYLQYEISRMYLEFEIQYLGTIHTQITNSGWNPGLASGLNNLGLNKSGLNILRLKKFGLNICLAPGL